MCIKSAFLDSCEDLKRTGYERMDYYNDYLHYVSRHKGSLAVELRSVLNDSEDELIKGKTEKPEVIDNLIKNLVNLVEFV